MAKVTLVEYLSELNSAETQWGLWVNPHDVDDYRVGQYCFENGGLNDGKQCIGNLEQLSFGSQSTLEILEYIWKEISFPDGHQKPDDADLLADGFYEESLDSDLLQWLKEQHDYLTAEWAQMEAELFVEELVFDEQE